MKILFICKHNRFRSKVAEAIFRKLNNNKKIKADSAGIKLDKKHPYVEPIVKKLMREKGYFINGKPKLITLKLHQESELMILVANNVKPEHFPDYYGKIWWWKIKDCDASETEKIRKIINEIEKRVKILVFDLK